MSKSKPAAKTHLGWAINFDRPTETPAESAEAIGPKTQPERPMKTLRRLATRLPWPAFLVALAVLARPDWPPIAGAVAVLFRRELAGALDRLRGVETAGIQARFGPEA